VRIAVYYNNNDVRVEEAPVPKIGPGELLVKVKASGICGTDVLEWYRLKTAPRVLGHEITGDVVEVGEGVSSYKIGDRIFVSHHVPCNTCRYCLAGHHTACETLHTTNYDPGGFAQYVRVPALNVDRGVYLLPDEVSYEEGTFIEPLACVLRAQMLARIRPASTVLILGSGISGLLHVMLSRALGASRVIATDVTAYRLEAARRFGAEATIDARDDVPARLRKVNNGNLADCVIVCTGALPAMIQALGSVDRGGAVIFFAPTEPGIDVPVPITELWRKEITMITSYGASPSDLSVALELIRAKNVKVNDLITHRLPLSQAGKGFQLVAEAQESLKVIIEPAGGKTGD
jgi:L-iditol 2-dehydrogenase